MKMITKAKSNWKTTVSIILTTITSLYQLFADNAEILGVDNKIVMIVSIVITGITFIINAIQNGQGETPIQKISSHFKSDNNSD